MFHAPWPSRKVCMLPAARALLPPTWLMVNVALLEQLVHLVLKVPVGIKVHKVLPVRKAHKVHLEVKEKPVPLEFLETKVLQDRLAQWVTKELLVQKD